MRKNLLIFIVCIVILLCAYRWGDMGLDGAKNTALENLYCGIVDFMCPAIGMYDAKAGELAYRDISEMFLPVLSTMGQSSTGTNGNHSGSNVPDIGKENSENPDTTTDAPGDTYQPEDSQIDGPKDTSQESEKAPQTPSTEESTETLAPLPGDAILASLTKKEVINRTKLQDFDYLRQKFYQVDNSTTIGRDLLDVEKLLGKDITLQSDVEGPQILIYHTHSQEYYKDSVKGEEATSIVAVGEYLAQLLSEQYGIEVLHNKAQYDVEDHAKSYSTALPEIEKILKKYPTIEVVIDLHRDGVAEDTHLVTEINGKPTAQIMFFNGLSRTTSQGQLTYLKNPYLEENLAFSFQMQLAAKEYFPGLTRKIYLKGYRYNMHLCPNSLLVEVGAQTNSFEEARNAMEPLAILLAKVLKTDKVP